MLRPPTVAALYAVAEDRLYLSIKLSNYDTDVTRNFISVAMVSSKNSDIVCPPRLATSVPLKHDISVDSTCLTLKL